MACPPAIVEAIYGQLVQQNAAQRGAFGELVADYSTVLTRARELQASGAFSIKASSSTACMLKVQPASGAPKAHKLCVTQPACPGVALAACYMCRCAARSWTKRHRSCGWRMRRCCAPWRTASTRRCRARRWAAVAAGTAAASSNVPCLRQPPRFSSTITSGPTCSALQFAAMEARAQALQDELTAAYKEKAALAEQSLQATRQLQVR